jgi:hypothetical protein
MVGFQHFISLFNRRNISLFRQLARIRLKPIIRTVTVFTKKRSGKKRQQLAFITIISILLQTVVFGFYSVFSLYLYGRPLCLDALHVSVLSSVQAIIVFLLSILAALRKKSWSNSYLLPSLGLLAVMVDLIIFSVAKTIWLVYIGKMISLLLSQVYCCFSIILVAVAIGSLFFIIMPVLRTKLSRLVETDEYAIVFIGAGIVETVGHSVVGVAANSIYNASLDFFPGLIFLVFALTGLFPLALMGYDYC